MKRKTISMECGNKVQYARLESSNGINRLGYLPIELQEKIGEFLGSDHCQALLIGAMRSCANGVAEQMLRMLREVEGRDENGNTALHEMLKMKDAGLVGRLMRKTKNIYERDARGRTAREAARQMGMVEMEGRLKGEEERRMAEAILRPGEVVITGVRGEKIAESELRNLMGGNFFGEGEWRRYFREDVCIGEIPELKYANVMALLQSENPFLKGDSRAGDTIAESHVLCLQPKSVNGGLLGNQGGELTVMKWREIMNNGLHSSSHRGGKLYDCDWYVTEDFANRSQASKWVLMPKEMLPGSYGSTYEGQVNQIGLHYRQYEVIGALELVGGIMQYYLNNGEADKLYGNGYKYMTRNEDELAEVRTKDVAKSGFHPYIGLSHDYGLRVDEEYANNWRSTQTGVGVVYRYSRVCRGKGKNNGSKKT